jgi:hypothetical protein
VSCGHRFADELPDFVQEQLQIGASRISPDGRNLAGVPGGQAVEVTCGRIDDVGLVDKHDFVAWASFEREQAFYHAEPPADPYGKPVFLIELTRHGDVSQLLAVDAAARETVERSPGARLDDLVDQQRAGQRMPDHRDCGRPDSTHDLEAIDSDTIR